MARSSDLDLEDYAIAARPHTTSGVRFQGAAGMDLCVAANNMMLSPGERALVPTGFQIAIPVAIRVRCGCVQGSRGVLGAFCQMHQGLLTRTTAARSWC